MADTPWRRGNRTLQVDASVQHAESSSVPGGAPAAGFGKFWVRDDAPNVPVFTNDAGTDFVLNEGASSAWRSETDSTTGANASNLIATPVSVLADGEQTMVEVHIFGVDNADATNTYYRRQIITYYRDGGNTTQWTVEEDGREQRRGTFPTSLTAGLQTSTNDVIVNADTTGIGGGVQINWTVLYVTRDSVTSAGSTSNTSVGPTSNVLTISGGDNTSSTSEKWIRIIDQAGGSSTTKPTDADTGFLFVATYGGSMLRVAASFDSDPGSTTFRVYKNFEVTASISATVTPVLVGGTYIGSVNFTSADTFDADDILIFSVQTTNAVSNSALYWSATYSNVTAGGAQVMGWDTTVYTSSFTAARNTKHKFDASTFSGTITMPSSPSTGDEVVLKNVSSSTNNVTLSGNGNNVEALSSYSLVASTSLTGDGASFTYSYDGTAWVLI